MEKRQFPSPGQDTLVGLIEEVLSTAFDMVKPGAAVLVAGLGGEPTEINVAFGWLHKAHSPRGWIANFSADPNLIERNCHSRWIIAKDLKTNVPLRELDNELFL